MRCSCSVNELFLALVALFNAENLLVDNDI